MLGHHLHFPAVLAIVIAVARVAVAESPPKRQIRMHAETTGKTAVEANGVADAPKRHMRMQAETVASATVEPIGVADARGMVRGTKDHHGKERSMLAIDSSGVATPHSFLEDFDAPTVAAGVVSPGAGAQTPIVTPMVLPAAVPGSPVAAPVAGVPVAPVGRTAPASPGAVASPAVGVPAAPLAQMVPAPPTAVQAGVAASPVVGAAVPVVADDEASHRITKRGLFLLAAAPAIPALCVLAFFFFTTKRRKSEDDEESGGPKPDRKRSTAFVTFDASPKPLHGTVESAARLSASSPVT